jgi:hypothetical protein
VSTRNAVISVFCLGLLGIAWFYPGWRLQHDLRKAAYHRYSELGEPEKVKEAVDRNHDEVFEQCYMDGMPHRTKYFDVRKYARLMDQRVQKDLGDAFAAKLEALVAKEQGSAAPASAAAPAPAAHAVEIRGMQVKPQPGEAGATGKTFDIQVDVEDTGGDIASRKTANLVIVVSCPDGQPWTADAPGMPATPTGTEGISRLSVPLTVPDSVVGSGNGMCELSATVTDPAGNVSQAGKRFVAMR